jgi:hypothetical protein
MTALYCRGHRKTPLVTMRAPAPWVQYLRATAIPVVAMRITRDGIPLIVLNTAGRPEVSDLFRVQAHVGQGEATSVWHFAYLHEHQLHRAWLVVRITDPVEVELVIEFNLDEATMWAVIDAAQRSGTIWLINNEGWCPGQPFADIRIATPPLPS